MLTESSCALGMFDGVHIGHQNVLSSAIKMAASLNCPSVAVTFSVHPQFITAHTPTPQLTTLEDRLDLFEKLGIDVAIVINFDSEFSKIPAEDYINKYLIEGLHARNISIGFDHQFGRGKKGNQFMLKEYSSMYNYTVQVIPPISIDGQIVSSSIIRKLLKYGEIEMANKLLGREYISRGSVVKGDQRGRTLGFPTANIKPSGNVLLPACGVYYIEIQISNSTLSPKFPAVLNIGYRPTFSNNDIATIEAFILDFDKNIYGEKIILTFKEKIRNEIKFNSPEELIKQIKKDVSFVSSKINSVRV